MNELVAGHGRRKTHRANPATRSWTPPKAHSIREARSVSVQRSSDGLYRNDAPSWCHTVLLPPTPRADAGGTAPYLHHRWSQTSPYFQPETLFLRKNQGNAEEHATQEQWAGRGALLPTFALSRHGALVSSRLESALRSAVLYNRPCRRSVKQQILQRKSENGKWELRGGIFKQPQMIWPW